MITCSVTSKPDLAKLVHFHQRGDLLLSGRAYYAVLHLDTTVILEQITPISTALENIGINLAEHIKDSEQISGRKKANSTRVDQVLTATLKQHLTFLSKDLLVRQQALMDFLKSLGKLDYDADPPNPQIRAQRGLINAGGEILSYVFGTAMDSEVQETKEILERLEALSEEQRSQINVHTDLLNTTVMHLDAVESQVTRVTTCLDAVHDNILQLENHLRDNSRHDFTLTHTLVMSSALSYASTALADLTSQLLTMKAGINKLKSGYLSTDMMSPKVILALAETITNRNLRPLFPATEEYLKSYYSYIRVWQLPHDALAFVIEIPLTGDPAVHLKLYEVVALPHPVSQDHVLAYSDLPRFLAVSDDREVYQERADQETCREFEETTICPIDQPIYKDTDKSCVMALFKGGSDRACQKHFEPASKLVKLEKTVLGWMYATSIRLELTITCAGKVEVVYLEPGSGRLQTGDNCKIASEQFILPASAEARGSVIRKNISLVYPFELELKLDEIESLKILNETPILTEIMTLAHDKLPLKSLRSEIGNLKHIQKMREINTISSHTGLTLAIISVIMSSVLAIGAILVCKYANQENDEVEQATPSQVRYKVWKPSGKIKLKMPQQASRRKSALELYPVTLATEQATTIEIESAEPLQHVPLVPRSPIPTRTMRPRNASTSTGQTTPGSPNIIENEAFFPVAHPRV